MMTEPNHNRVKLGLWIGGIISVLLLVLYIPVMIWSPPWSDHAFYLSEHKYPVINSGHFIYHRNDNLTFTVYRDNQWNTFDKPIIEEYPPKGLPVGISRSDWELDKTKCMKITNPFTIWRIKWLEWTAE